MRRRVVVTGLGPVSPLGIGTDTFWRNLLTGVSSAKSLDQVTCSPIFGVHEFGSKVIHEVSDFNPTAWGVPVPIQEMDRFIQFAWLAARLAVEDARLRIVNPRRAGVALATAICGTQTMEEEYLKVTDRCRSPIRPAGVSQHLYTASMSNSASLIIAQEYGLQGECLTLSTGCIGGLDAIGYAYESIAWGETDVMLAGAAEAPISPITIAAFDIIHCLSRRNDSPTQASRPFTASRDGFVLSEGAAVIVLEELEHARRRAAPIYAEITACAITSNATHMTDMANEGMDLARAMGGALRRAEVAPEAVDFVNSHGTSTPQNDRCETQAIKTVLGEHAYRIPINSTKSMLGHSLAAASALEVVACCLSFRDQRIHPTINQVDIDPDCDLDYVPEGPRAVSLKTLLTDASGFSGLHAVLVLRQYSEDVAAP